MSPATGADSPTLPGTIVRGTLTSCDRSGIPSTSPWTGVTTIAKGSWTKTCIVTRPRTSPGPMRSLRPGDLRNDGGRVAGAGADGSEAGLDGTLDGALRPDDRRGEEI